MSTPTPQPLGPAAVGGLPRTPTAATNKPLTASPLAQPGAGLIRSNPVGGLAQRSAAPPIASSPATIRVPPAPSPQYAVPSPRVAAAAVPMPTSMSAPASPYRRPQPKRLPEAPPQSSGIPRGPSQLVGRPKRSRIEPRPPGVVFERLHTLIPESKLFSQLLDLEKTLDRAVLRKQLDIQEAIRVRPARINKLLRVYVSNTYSAQGPAYQTDESSASLFEAPSWSLRIEGCLVDASSGAAVLPSPRRRFSTHLKRVFVQMTDTRGVVKEAVEWSKTSTPLLGDAMDGFEIKRRGTVCIPYVTASNLFMQEELLCRILLWLDWVPERFRLSQPLSAVLGMHTETRPRVLMALWQYIKLHKLQDQEDRKIIHNNAELKAVFGCESISFTQIPQLINDHLLVPEPVEIQYSMKLKGDPLDTEEVWDIPFEIDEQVSVNLQPQHKKDIDSYDELIMNSVRGIAEHKANRDFLLNFANNPAEFLNTMVSCQTRDWTISNSHDPRSVDDEDRFVPFYYQPLVHDAVSQYLAKNPAKAE